MRKKMFFIVPAAIVGIVLFGFLGGEIVMRLWNWLLPGLFGWRQISYWQALGLLALCRILFGRSGWHRAGRSNFRGRMRKRWQGMSPEDREKFRQGMGGRCGAPAEAAATAQP